MIGRFASAFALALFIANIGSIVAAQGRLHIVVVEGENGVNIIQQKTAVSPVVEVRDQNNNPVAGAAVTFAIKGGSAKALLGNGAKQLVVTTNAAGRATVAVNPVANGSFEIQVNASMSGQTASATISQTNVANAADAAKAASKGGGHTGLIVTTAVVAGGGIAGWKAYEKYQDEQDSDNGCALLIGQQPAAASAAGGNFSYTVQSDCTWTATTDQPWLALTGPTSATSNSGSATNAELLPVILTYTVQPNTTGVARVGHIVITPKVGGPSQITINQNAS